MHASLRAGIGQATTGCAFLRQHSPETPRADVFAFCFEHLTSEEVELGLQTVL